MSYTMGDIPVPVILTRDEIRTIRGMIKTRREEPAPGLIELLNKINNAEDQATIAHAQRKAYDDALSAGRSRDTNTCGAPIVILSDSTHKTYHYRECWTCGLQKEKKA